MIDWQQILKSNGLPWQENGLLPPSEPLATLADLRRFLDTVHISQCLVKPYQLFPDYPLVDSRELLPSFDNAMLEYKNLPGFSIVAFDRQLSFFDEKFQYDALAAPGSDVKTPQAKQILTQNLQTLLARIPRIRQDAFRSRFSKEDITAKHLYPDMLPFLLDLDRAHVLARNEQGEFQLAGIYASFTNDIDAVLKRFGQNIGMFEQGNNALYAKNRLFVYQYLMELYGFPVVSERRTSSAMFARRLNKRGENYLLRVLGQTDRTITTYTSRTPGHIYPRIDKIALVAVDSDQTDAIEIIRKKGFFLDEERRVIILKVTYRQHRYNADNVRKDRALSVESQEIIHPLTGEVLKGLNIIRDASNMYLRLNDIVRGEYTGHIIYKRQELIESTETDEKRLKALDYWLSRSQRRIIDYSDDFYTKLTTILTGYLYSPDKDEDFASLRTLHREVCARLSYIQQARSARSLEELSKRRWKGEKLGYRPALRKAVELVSQLRFEIVNFFPELVQNVIACIDRITSDRYLYRTYIQEGQPLSKAGKEIKRLYGTLVSAHDEFKAILKAKRNASQENRTQD